MVWITITNPDGSVFREYNRSSSRGADENMAHNLEFFAFWNWNFTHNFDFGQEA